MTDPQPGALAASQAAEAKATAVVDLTSSKHQPAVHVTALSASPSVAAAPTSRPNSRSSPSREGSINSQNLAWDQAVLRIEYLVSTMTTPSPYSPISSPLDNAPLHNNMNRPLSPLAGFALNSPPATPSDDRVKSAIQAGDADALPATKGWPSVPREKVRRKVLQIDTWRAEVAAHGVAAYCACSSPAPMREASSGNENPSKQSGSPQDVTAPILPTDIASVSPSEPGNNTILAPIVIPPATITCGFCSRPPTPFVALKSPTVAAGVKKAFVDSFKGLLRRRSASRKGREKDREKAKIAEGNTSEKDKSKRGREGEIPLMPGELGRQTSGLDSDNDGTAFTRTAMYRADMPPAQPKPQSPQSPAGGHGGQDSNDGDDEEVDIDNLSRSTNPRALLQRDNDRLKRAEKLLAKNRGGGPKAGGAVEGGTKSLPIDSGGGGGSSGFGLGWGKNNGDRSRKGFGKLL